MEGPCYTNIAHGHNSFLTFTFFTPFPKQYPAWQVIRKDTYLRGQKD